MGHGRGRGSSGCIGGRPRSGRSAGVGRRRRTRLGWGSGVGGGICTRRRGSRCCISGQFKPHIVVLESVSVSGAAGRPHTNVDLICPRLQLVAREIQVGVPPGTLGTQAHDGVETHVGRVKTGGRVGDRGISTIRGAHDRCGLDGPIDRKDASRVKNGRKSDVKAGVLGRCGRCRQIEIDLGSRAPIGGGRGVEGSRLAIIPIRRVMTGAYDIADPVGILGRIVQESGPVRGGVIGGTSGVGRQDAAIGCHVMVPIVEFVGIPVRGSDLPHCGAQAQGRPSQSS